MARFMTRAEPSSGSWSDMRRFREEMSQLLSSFAREGPALAGSFPALNVWQDDANIYVEAELPGMDLSDLEIYVTGGDQLMIKGERKPPQIDKGVWHRQERAFGSFTRALTLPVPVDADKVQARLANGVLSLTLPKSEAAKPKKIAVKAE
jgi:HSP20 family protein